MLNFCFRRTGKDITEGKVIRKDEEGYEIFDGALDIFNVLQYMYEVFPDLCLKNT